MFSGIILHALASSEINSIAASYPVSKRANHAVLEARFENAPWAKHNESVLLTTYGCDYSYVEWKISTPNILGHPLDAKRQITQTGPGFYKARCKEDFMVNSDWITAYVDLDGSIVPVMSGPNSLCPNTAATVTTAGCPSGYYFSTFRIGGPLKK